MWKRFATTLRCPLCRGEVELEAFVETHEAAPSSGVATRAQSESAALDLNTYVEEGQLLCRPCGNRFPIIGGLPIMLPYTTPLHAEFEERWRDRLRESSPNYRFADREAPPGEDFVRGSFSQEWLEYDYDGVIWELSYKDHEIRFRKEVGPAAEGTGWFLEVGCGLGLATAVAQSCSQRDCVGMDLSLGVTKAAREFKSNPFMHFVQASAFAPPFAVDQFDVIYSRGVLHHTYSTHKAFESVAPLCKPGGTFFLWLYGPGSTRSTPLRVALYAIESVTRPIISRAPNSIPSKMFLGTMALGYMVFNWGRRLGNGEIQSLTFRRAMHAARDRFTPRYAHRHPAAEICGWFSSSGFDSVTVLDWRDMPAADQDDFRRNVGVRAVRAAQTAIAATTDA